MLEKPRGLQVSSVTAFSNNTVLHQQRHLTSSLQFLFTDTAESIRTLTHQDVVSQSILEQGGGLLNQCNVVCQPCGRQLIDSETVNFNSTRLWLVKVQQQITQGGLTGTRSTNQESSLASWEMDRDILQDLGIWSSWIGEVDVLELDVTVASFWICGNKLLKVSPRIKQDVKQVTTLPAVKCPFLTSVEPNQKACTNIQSIKNLRIPLLPLANSVNFKKAFLDLLTASANFSYSMSCVEKTLTNLAEDKDQSKILAAPAVSVFSNFWYFSMYLVKK
ncbi:hypothetical protein WICPIJ_009846 [Wickerhamomyces pijperi]|uniref:Uncharacterized protein n=1 Tax=Wickerhamomyces pijperi TaxID=599730 RepID=A0A9P8PK79_WICPI|nr:hypothetical protein WICPIJ_009846 [Wickerhamomyces pijperi]